MVKFPNQRRLLADLLKTYSKFLPKPKFEDIDSRPKQLQDIPSEMLIQMKDCIISALHKGMPSFFEENISLEKYIPFSDAVASQIVGKIDVAIRGVIKVGGTQLRHQIEFIENQKPQYKKLYPTILGRYESNDNYVCLMEFLSDYVSFHDMIFGENGSSKEEIERALDCIFDILTEVYQSEKDNIISPNLSVLYINERIKPRVANAEMKFITKEEFLNEFNGMLPDKFTSLLESTIEIDGLLLNSYTGCLPLVERRIREITPGFATLVHGDAHPGNIMLKNHEGSYKMRFLDPNPYIEKADYIYDMGKIIHWLDKMGFLILERKLHQQIIGIDMKGSRDTINIAYLFPQSISMDTGKALKLQEIMTRKEYALNYTFRKIETLAQVLGDPHWKERLHLSIASAYLGGLAYFEEPTQVVTIFVEGLKNLNKFLLS